VGEDAAWHAFHIVFITGQILFEKNVLSPSPPYGNGAEECGGIKAIHEPMAIALAGIATIFAK
jgi:hypothetical protein